MCVSWARTVRCAPMTAGSGAQRKPLVPEGFAETAGSALVDDQVEGGTQWHRRPVFIEDACLAGFGRPIGAERGKVFDAAAHAARVQDRGLEDDRVRVAGGQRVMD